MAASVTVFVAAQQEPKVPLENPLEHVVSVR